MITMWLFVTTTHQSSYTDLLRHPLPVLVRHPLPVLVRHPLPILVRHPLPILSTPIKNFVYIKTHKCASDTLSAVFRRYGYERRLSFVLPVEGSDQLGWPQPLDEGMFRPSKTGGYNILCEHTILTLPLMTDIMPNDTMFVTSLREPMERLKSAFSYFNLPKVVAITGPDTFTEYLRNLDKYDDVYKSKGNKPRRAYCIPDGLSMTKNSMAFDLGFPTGFPGGTIDQTKNVTFIDEWVEMLDKKVDIALIVEYFQESTVLMRRTFGWNIKDILYMRRNTTPVRHALGPVDPQLVRKYKAWSRVDYKLHDHFNRTLWRKIADEGDDFWNELEYFKRALNETNTFCQRTGYDRTTTTLHFAATDWSASFNVSMDDCETINSRLLPDLRRQYDAIHVKVKHRRRTGVRCSDL